MFCLDHCLPPSMQSGPGGEMTMALSTCIWLLKLIDPFNIDRFGDHHLPWKGHHGRHNISIFQLCATWVWTVSCSPGRRLIECPGQVTKAETNTNHTFLVGFGHFFFPTNLLQLQPSTRQQQLYKHNPRHFQENSENCTKDQGMILRLEPRATLIF